MNATEIAKEHLKQAASLISHAMELLGLNDDTECEHEQAAIPEVVYKCVKCGEFYR